MSNRRSARAVLGATVSLLALSALAACSSGSSSSHAGSTAGGSASTSKTVKAKSFGTPVVDEAAFTQLLRDVAAADG